MEERAREALELFVDKADWLAGCGYVQWLQANRGTALLISSEQDGSTTSQHTRPDRDDTDALVLTFRFFIQDKEYSSFRWLANNVLNDAGLSDRWKQGFTKVRDELNAWLDGPSDLTEQYEAERKTRGLPTMDEQQLTKGELMHIFIYGDAAHANPDKKKTFKRWRANRIWFEMARLEFDRVLMGALKAIWAVARLSERELASQTTPRKA